MSDRWVVVHAATHLYSLVLFGTIMLPGILSAACVSKETRMAIVSSINDAFVRVLNSANEKLRREKRYAIAIVGKGDEYRVSLYAVGPDYRRLSEMESVKTNRVGIRDAVMQFGRACDDPEVPAFLLGSSGRIDYPKAWTLVDPGTFDVRVFDRGRIEAFFNC